MGADSKIEWTTHTWNPWIGCSKVSLACANCYAEDLMDQRYGRARWGAGEDRVRTAAGTWSQPLKWDRAAGAAGRIDTVFCLSLGDIWDNEVDPLWRRDAIDVMRRTPNLLYLLLSKRIGNAVRMCNPFAGNPLLPSNAALGATMVNQEEWDRDMPKLRRAGEMLGARFTFASVEPMLGPIDARGDLPNWVIVGGESGPRARPMHPDWARSLRDQCQAAGTAFFFKQWGEWAPDGWVHAHTPFDRHHATFNGRGEIVTDRSGLTPTHNFTMQRVGKKAAGRLLDGRTWDEMPARAA